MGKGRYANGTTVITQPSSTVIVVNNGRSNGRCRRSEFTYGVFDCCGDCSACCKSIWCPCLVHLDAANAAGMNGCCWCWLSALFPFLECCITCQIRARLVPSNCCSNCLVSWFLPCCTLTQMAREIKVV
jgi:Cys-rich protein (TIGR01571 family)